MISGLGVAYVTAGFLVLWSGVKNVTVQDELRAFLKGQLPQPSPTGAPSIGIASGGSTAPSGGTSGAAPVTGGTGAVNGCTAKQTAANKATGQLMAASYGWGSGAEWAALNALVMSESGWCNVAQNPGSSAYGIGQFLDSTWSSVGYSKTSNAATQIAAMLKYVKQRYGDPVKAWAFHRANNYY